MIFETFATTFFNAILLEHFFKDNMAQQGFNSNEIQDFIDYWMPLLTESMYYNIYPQHNEIIDQAIVIDISVNPDHVNRLFYVVEESTHKTDLELPEVREFTKTGFYINEWGVILQ